VNIKVVGKHEKDMEKFHFLKCPHQANEAEKRKYCMMMVRVTVETLLIMVTMEMLLMTVIVTAERLLITVTMVMFLITVM
jgi:hypothetical protein